MEVRMLRLAAALTLALIVLAPLAAWAGETYVDGYYRKDGTYIAPHWRSTPDSSYNNNWSTWPNINPHTGQQGTREPKVYDVNPSYQTPGTFNPQGGMGWPPQRR